MQCVELVYKGEMGVEGLSQEVVWGAVFCSDIYTYIYGGISV